MTNDPYKRRVREVMSKAVVSVRCEDTLHDALTMMEENRISALPVVDARERAVGILTATDLIELTRELESGLSDLTRVSDVSRRWLLERLAEHDVGQQSVGERMTRTVAGVAAEATLNHAAVEMLRHRVHHLPVLDKQQTVVGIISTTDILAAFVEGAV